MATGLVIQVTVALNQTDLQYYHYVIQSGALVVLSVLGWLIVSWKVWQIKKFRKSS
jgi:hypothetical protein